jgi:dTDP-4-dehydrorhamnose reductase
MKACIAGAGGQLGRSLLQSAPSHIETLGASHAEVDICEKERVLEFVARHRPQVIINAAAYTGVDRAESEPQNAFRANVEGVRNLALAAERVGARLIHVSTNYVFDGEQSTPYLPSSTPRPISVYGQTKYQGEQVALGVPGKRGIVVRTAWVYAATGSNFVSTMLRLMAERDAVAVVADQVGTPTWAATLAAALWRFAERSELHGIYHWTDGGVATWYEFAVAIQEEALARGLLTRSVPIRALQTSEYPTPARRPRYGVLDTRSSIEALGYGPLPWRDNLRRMLDGMAAA